MNIISSALGFLGGIKTTLIVGAVTAVVAFGAGWYNGSTHEAKIMAVQAVNAASVAQQAQSKKDQADWLVAKADYEKRHAADVTANDTLKSLLAKRHALVPNPMKATVSVDAMKALNDPAILGEDGETK